MAVRFPSNLFINQINERLKCGPDNGTRGVLLSNSQKIALYKDDVNVVGCLMIIDDETQTPRCWKQRQLKTFGKVNNGWSAGEECVACFHPDKPEVELMLVFLSHRQTKVQNDSRSEFAPDEPCP